MCIRDRATKGVGNYFMVEAHVERVHAAPAIVVDGTDHVNPRSWQPLIYAFRHYFELATTTRRHGPRAAELLPLNLVSKPNRRSRRSASRPRRPCRHLCE